MESAKRKQKNIVDPFSSLLIAHSFNLETATELDNLENSSAALRGISNPLGKFHQTILGAIPGWSDHDAGYDLECVDKSIIAEVKNKHNTMNASNRAKVIEDLETAIRQKRGNWSAYLVQIIPKSPHRDKKLVGKRVYEIDGASFYALATGYDNALHELFDIFCERLSLSDSICKHCKNVMAATLPPRI
ncbi:MAG: Eco47II family restriction endonuclease [Paracoccaceae bacterium]|nr:Eco47II family restriction endonuclease [Paracoccaceae bacterium]MDE2917397.1 Eco47II family restriction endonuclease [Paracoccaceae bacterium]